MDTLNLLYYSPIMYSLFTHGCPARPDYTAIIKFADDTTVVGLIPDKRRDSL